MWPFFSKTNHFEKELDHQRKGEKIAEYLNKLCTKDCKQWSGSLAANVADWTGSALDYMATTKSFGPENWAFVLQLGGTIGKFVIPREEIVPIAEDQYKAVKWFLRHEM